MDKGLTAPFDQYQRYGMAARAIEMLRENSKDSFSILEVGANGHKLLRVMLPSDKIVFLDCEFPEEMQADPDVIIGDATQLALPDSSYDLVVALDVFEHILPEKRLDFLSEINRVARLATVICAPFCSNKVVQAEQEANRQWETLYGSSYRWLAEHQENGLPDLEVVSCYLEENGLCYRMLHHGEIHLWADLLKAHFSKEYEDELRPLVSQMDAYYNETLFERDFSDRENSYRTFIFTFKEDSVALKLNDLSRMSENPPPLKLETDLISQVSLASCALAKKIKGLNETIVKRDGQIAVLNQTMAELLNSRSWRLTEPLRSIGHKLRRARELRHLFQGSSQTGGFFKTIFKALKVVKREGLRGVKRRLLNVQHSYSEWIRRYDTLDDMARERICVGIERFSRRPKISVIMPVYDPSPEFLDQAIWSVRNQLYRDWELCIADDASKNEEIRELLCRHANEDSRIRVVYRHENGHISRASNSALEITAGEFVALLDHDDCLHPEALFELAKCILEDPLNDLIYTDEDKIDTAGRRALPFFKPDWSPHLALSQAYLGHLVSIRTSLLKSLGGWRSQTDGAQDYDLWLRAAVCARKIKHIPRILYHWRMHPHSTAQNTESKPYAHEAGRRAVQSYVEERYPENIIKVQDGEHPFTYCAAFELPPQLRVSIIIPTRDRLDLLRPCVDSILRVTSWRNFELIILDNGSSDPEILEYLSEITNSDIRTKVVPADMPFNWSRLNNLGAKVAEGDVFVFLNNDTKVITPEWLQILAGYANLPDVGTVGALLLFEDGTIQHCGTVVGMGGWADHVFRMQPPLHSGVGPFVSPVLTRNVLAVTGACMAISREKFEQLGGFDEEFMVCGSDVELGLRAYHKGWYSVMCAEVRLTHFESKTRTPNIPEGDFTQSALKYAPYRVDQVDPFFNQNLSLNYTQPRIGLDR